MTGFDLLEHYRIDDRARAHLRVNMIASIDGAATRDGRAGALGNPTDQHLLAGLRELADVVMVGAGTIRAEGYGGPLIGPAAQARRRAAGLPAHPRLAIVTAAAALEPSAPVFTRAPTRPLLLTRGRRDGDAHPGRERRLAALAQVSDIVTAGESSAGALDLPAAAALLAERGMPQILSEGGPRLLGDLIAADAVDEVCLTLAPTLEGGDASRIAHTGAAATPRGMRLVHAHPRDGLLFLRYQRQ